MGMSCSTILQTNKPKPGISQRLENCKLADDNENPVKPTPFT